MAVNASIASWRYKKVLDVVAIILSASLDQTLAELGVPPVKVQIRHMNSCISKNALSTIVNMVVLMTS